MSSSPRVLTPLDAAAAAALHALAFDDAWSEAGFAAQLSLPGAAALGQFEAEGLIAFALFQCAAGEGDLLTVATHPARRGEGLAGGLLAALMQSLQAQGVRRFTLDVAEDNAAARRLYVRLGFTEDGRRPRYYTAGRVVPADAILMSRASGV